MSLDKDSKQIIGYSIVAIALITSVLLFSAGGSVTRYHYDAKVTPVDSMDSIDSDNVVKYSTLTEYEQELVQKALDNDDFNTRSTHYETLETDKNVNIDNRVVNINGVVAHININENSNTIPDFTTVVGVFVSIFSLVGLLLVLFQNPRSTDEFYYGV